VLKSPYNRAFLIFRCDPITGRNRERDFKGTGSRARPEQNQNPLFTTDRAIAAAPSINRLGASRTRGGCLPERCATFPRLNHRSLLDFGTITGSRQNWAFPLR